jgi:rubredoxin
MADLLRCRPCGYVIREDKLNDVCPACGLPREVFEPYREKVSSNRKFILSFDLHPIAIHLSQTFVVLIPILLVFNYYYPEFKLYRVHSVLDFCIDLLPFSLVLATITGVIDGVTRFKSLKTPLLRVKIIVSIIIMTLSFLLFYITPNNVYGIETFIISIAMLCFAVLLGLWGKKLLDVILPGTIRIRKKKKLKML